MSLPDPAAVARIFSELTGRACAAGRDPGGLDLATAKVAAEFCRDDGNVVVVVLADAALTNGAGAALAMMPAGRADDATASGDVDPDLLANFSEILNIASRLINDGGDVHVKLAVTTILPEATDATATLVAAPSKRVDVSLAVDGYGTGRLSLLAA